MSRSALSMSQFSVLASKARSLIANPPDLRFSFRVSRFHFGALSRTLERAHFSILLSASTFKDEQHTWSARPTSTTHAHITGTRKYTRPAARHGSGPSRADAPKYGRFHASSRWTSCIVQLPASPASIRSNSRLGLRPWHACDGVQGGVSKADAGLAGLAAAHRASILGSY